MEKAEKNIQKRESTQIERPERTRSGKVYAPPVDIIESDNEILLLADMPGISEKSINVMLEQGVLTIEAILDEYHPEGMELSYQEYDFGDYQRSFSISDDIDREKIAATYKNGVLEIKLPKKEPVKPKKITVKTSD
jgi:HSP20 family protein